MEHQKLTLDKIRKHISNDCLEHVLDCQMFGRVTYLVIASFPGSGKTTSILKAIDEAGYTWLYFAPFHDVIMENLEYSKLREYEYIHFMGKNQDGMCLVPDYIELMDNDVNITPFCETRCVLKNSGCPYYETKTKIESYPYCWAGVHSHIPTYLQTFLYQIKYDDERMFKHYDVLIIDEFPFQVLFNQVVVNDDEINKVRDVIHHMPETPEKLFVKDFLDYLILSTQNISIDYSGLVNLISSNRSLDFSTFLKEYDTTILRLISNKIINKPPENLAFNISLIHEENPDFKKLKWMVLRHKWDGWSKPGVYVTTSNIDYFRNFPIPVIALDATADISAWNTLLNGPCSYEKIDIKYKKTYQLKSSGRYPVSTWIDIENNVKKLSSSGERLCELIMQVCSRKKNAVLVCSNKRIREVIEGYMEKNYNKKNYEFAIYYNLRSRNSYYETCDTCILAHEPNIPPLQLEIMENVIGWDRNLLRDLMTTSEMLQAIGRIRQNILVTPEGRVREDVEIYILPGALEDKDKLIEEAKIVPYRNIYVGDLKTMRKVLKDMIRKLGKTDLRQLKQLTSKICSVSYLKKELINLFKDGHISNFRRNIEWIYDDAKKKEVEYERSFTQLYENF